MIDVIPLEHLMRFCPKGRKAELLTQWSRTNAELDELLPRHRHKLRQCHAPIDEPSAPADRSLESVERAHVEKVLRETGCKRKAAAILCINEATLHRKLARWRKRT